MTNEKTFHPDSPLLELASQGDTRNIPRNLTMLAGCKIVRWLALLLLGGIVVAPVCPQETGSKQSTSSQKAIATKKTGTATVPSARGATTKKNAQTMASLQGNVVSAVATTAGQRSKPDALQQEESDAEDDSSLSVVPEEPAVPDEIAAQAREFFDRGASFYIYAEKNDIWRGRGVVEGRIRYVKNPESQHESVKAYAFTEGMGLYGERRRFGLFCDPDASADTHGELRVVYNGVRRTSSMFHVTVMTLSGKALLHVVLYPGDLKSRSVPRGLPKGFISNELVIPIDF